VTDANLAVPISPRTGATLALASMIGMAMFAWPLVLPVAQNASQPTTQAPYFFVVVIAIVMLLAVTQVLDGGLDPKALAMLGVLSAVNAALRPLGAGLNGFEPMLFLLIVAGRVFGPGFGFLLGCSSMFASALLTAGVGPWLPFQMLASAWVGLGAGLLPRRPAGRAEIAVLAVFAAFAAYAFGLIMNLWFWPFMAGSGTALSYVPGASMLSNLHRFLVFTLATSTALWDTGRAITNIVLVILLGPGVLDILRRAVRRANIG